MANRYATLLQSQSIPAPTPEQVSKQSEPVKENKSLEPQTASTPASKHASSHASNRASIIDIVRKTLRETGKEVLYVRLTVTEKAQVRDVAYALERRGTKMSETEIGRIAVDFLLQDYERNRENSVLLQVIDALNR